MAQPKKKILKRGYGGDLNREFVKNLESLIMISDDRIQSIFDKDEIHSFDSLLFKMQIKKKVYMNIIYKRLEEFMNIYALIDDEVNLNNDDLGMAMLYNIIFNIFTFVHFNNMMIRNHKNYKLVLDEIKSYDNSIYFNTEVKYPPIFFTISTNITKYEKD